MEHPYTLGDAYWSDPDDIAERFAYKDGESFWLGRNPQRFEDKIGSLPGDDTHIGLFGKTRGAKGRSFVVPNIVKWKGSVVSVDPKGENASICAARRAQGDRKHCGGIGQETYVLDPNRRTKNVPDELYASCNLLDCLDPNDPDLYGKCTVLVDALTIKPDGGESADWSAEGIRWSALVIAHVVTSDLVPDSSRHLVLVRDFVTLGNEAAVEMKRQQNIRWKKEYDAAIERWEAAGSPDDEEPKEPKLWPKIDPIDQLLDEMAQNQAINGAIAKSARKFRKIRQGSVKQWAGIYGHATRELEFLNNLNIQDSLFGEMKTGQRSLKIRGIKDDPNGVSIFICLKGRGGDPAIRWQRALLSLICEEMQEWQGLPACGHPMLISIDEFLDLKHMEQIQTVLNQGAGAGIKLFLSILNISGLYRLYGEHGGEEILAGLDTKIWLGLNDNVTPKWLENHIGEAHVEIDTTSKTKGKSKAKSKTNTKAKTTGTSGSESHTEGTGHNWGTAITDGTNENETVTESDAKTQNTSKQWSVQEGTSLGRNSSRSHGRQFSRNFKPDQLLRSPFPATTDGVNSSRQYGTQQSKNRSKSIGGQEGNARTLSTARAKSTGKQHSISRNENFNTQSSETYTKGWMKSETDSESIGTVDTEQESETVQQTLHKRPLLTRPLFNRLSRTFTERDHPLYPGLALVTIGGEDAFFVLKSHYDEDPEFAGTFTPHYAYPFIPIKEQQLLGAQYTAEHILPMRVPDIVLEQDLPLSVQVHVPCDEWFKAGDKLFSWEIVFPETPRENLTVPVLAPCEGKVIDIDTDYAETGQVMCIRTEFRMLEHHRDHLYQLSFSPLIEARAKVEKEAHERKEAERKKELRRKNDLAAKQWEQEKEEKRRARVEQIEAHQNIILRITSLMIICVHIAMPLIIAFGDKGSASSQLTGFSAPASLTLTSIIYLPATVVIAWVFGIIYATLQPAHPRHYNTIADQVGLSLEGVFSGIGKILTQTFDSDVSQKLAFFLGGYAVWYVAVLGIFAIF